MEGELKMCKEKLLETISILVNFTKIPWQKHPPNTQIQRFSKFIQLVKLSDELYFIEKSPESLIFLLSALANYSDFFVKFVLKTPDSDLKLWDSIIAKEGISKNEMLLVLSSQFIHPNRVYLHEKRQEDEIALNMQILLRNELKRGETVGTEFDIVGDVELDATVIDVDEACIIIQNAERMYQAISRFFHLVDVRQKALDLQVSTKETDPLKAIVKIQAITRGYLTRKRVRILRDEENLRLGLNLEALIQSTKKHLTTKFLKDLKPEQRFFAEDELPTPPNSLQQLEIFLKDNFFSTDPLTLRDPPTVAECRKVDEMTEYYFGEVFLAEAVKLQPPTTAMANVFIKFDDLISTITYIKSKGGKTCHLDLRNFLYATVIIPHALSPWNQFDIKRKSILIVGDSKSGKSAWSQAMALKCLSPRIRISKRIFTRKFTRRKRVMEIINQFVKMDKYCFVEFDKLEMFSGKKQRRTPIKALILKLFHSLKRSNAQIIGLSKTADLNPEILGEFDFIVTLKTPNGIDRYNLLADTFSRRMNENRLLKIPHRFLELSRTTKKLNTGETVEKIDKKFASPMPPSMLP